MPLKNRSVNSRLTKLVDSIGAPDTAVLIETALPVIIERRNVLSRLLVAGDMEAAAACAHKTLGSVRLYGTAELESLLKQVKTLGSNSGDLAGFERRLYQEFSSVISNCNQFVKNK